MSKKSTKSQIPTEATVIADGAVQQTVTEPTRYTVVPPKRPLTGTKYGLTGNAATHAALAEAAVKAGGTLTHAEAMAVCTEMAHKGFLSYAINRLRVVVPAQQIVA